ncbi:MAG: VWA domain-containing protein [Sandaracinaceae bacterium]
MPSLTLGWPVALWALVAVPLLAALAWRSRYPLGRTRQGLVLLTRAVAVSLVALAVADLRLAWPTDRLAVATVIDASRSVSTEARAGVRAAIEAAREAHPRVTWVAAETTAPAAGVHRALAALPRDRVRRLLLATDGRDPGPSLGAALAAARRSGVEVSVLPVGDRPPFDRVAVTGVRVPRLARAGDRVDLAVDLHASEPGTVTLEARIDGQAVATEAAEVRAGTSVASLGVTLPDREGVHELTVALTSGGGPVTRNDRWRSLFRVAPKPRVRILHDPDHGPPALAEVLTDGGFRVEVPPIAEAPERLEALRDDRLVVVDEASLQDTTETQQRTLRTWVEEAGGGLITVTGRNPVRRTPRILREIEPIQVPPALPEPRPLELVIVIDRSSSMSGSKIRQARAAAIAAVGALRPDARVGVVAFSDGADRVLAPVGVERSDEVVRFIHLIVASGGTNIAAALTAANAVMSRDPRYLHHVILLSDGVSEEPPALASARMLAGRGVSISAITLGRRNTLMAEIADIGRGRYHVTSSAGSLPSLFVREAQYRQPPAHRRVRFRPRVVAPLGELAEVPWDAAPSLLGHALAATRPGAETVLGAPEGRPLLAHWHRGLGQVATFTSATNGPWADAWRTWPGFRAFWVRLAEHLQQTRPVEPVTLHLEPDPLRTDRQLLTVQAPALGEEPVPEVRLHRAVDGAETPALLPVGPGLWQAAIEAGDGFLVTARMPDDDGPTAAIGHARPFDPELATFGVVPEALERLAEVGGGAVLDEPAAVVGAVPSATVLRSLRLPLLTGALGLYLRGVLLLRLPDPSVGATVTRPERRRRGGGRVAGARRRWEEAA